MPYHSTPGTEDDEMFFIAHDAAIERRRAYQRQHMAQYKNTWNLRHPDAYHEFLEKRKKAFHDARKAFDDEDYAPQNY